MSDLNIENKYLDRRPIRAELDSDLYPERIKIILGNKAPKHLDMLGNTDLLNMAGLGFSGSRKSSPKGLEIVQDCVDQVIKNNVIVVSGNAAGVDFAAHYNCLKAGGKTIFVLPEGINYFRIKKALQTVWDWERVLVISQFEPDEPWKAFRAMSRNQLIIALSRVMIVIEADVNGGTMNTGKATLKSGLPLYVAQFQDMSFVARGNKLLHDMGALKLSKSRSTNRADLTNVFESIKDDKILKHIPQQLELL